MEAGKENVNSDSIGVEPLLSPGIQEEASVEGDKGVKKSTPDAGLKTGITVLASVPCDYNGV